MNEGKRKPPNAGKGRPKGAQNKTTKAFKEAVLTVYHDIGGNDALANWARENQSEFYKICARLIPTEVNANIGTTHYVARMPTPCDKAQEWEWLHRPPESSDNSSH